MLAILETAQSSKKRKKSQAAPGKKTGLQLETSTTKETKIQFLKRKRRRNDGEGTKSVLKEEKPQEKDTEE